MWFVHSQVAKGKAKLLEYEENYQRFDREEVQSIVSRIWCANCEDTKDKQKLPNVKERPPISTGIQLHGSYTIITLDSIMPFL